MGVYYKVNKTTNIVENVEVWDAQPAETADHKWFPHTDGEHVRIDDTIAPDGTVTNKADTPPSLEEIKTERNLLLQESDFTQLPDISDSILAGTKAEWATYRQALRDVPDNLDENGFPVWPTMPTN